MTATSPVITAHLIIWCLKLNATSNISMRGYGEAIKNCKLIIIHLSDQFMHCFMIFKRCLLQILLISTRTITNSKVALDIGDWGQPIVS
jgi:hypothetical protein